jgi:ribosomal protein S18 acetylase RimI-like enzyme
MQTEAVLADKFFHELQLGNRITFVAINDKEFIAEGSLVFDMNDTDYTIKNKRVYLSRLIVKDTFRRLGVGNMIVEHLLNYAENLGFTEFSIGVDRDNIAARKLYEKKGFNKVMFEGSDESGSFVKLLRTKG